MNKLLIFYILIVPITGIAVTLASGLYVQDQSHPGMTHFSYGLPLGWREYYQPVVLPFPPPTIIYHWDNFIIDFVIWAVVLGMPVAIAVANVAQRRLVTKTYEQKPTQQ